MPLADAGTSVRATSTGPTELFLHLPVRRQVNTNPSQFAKRPEMGNVGRALKTLPLNPRAPSHQLQGRKGRRDVCLLSRTAFLQNKLWEGSSPACNCRQPPCPGMGSPDPLRHAGGPCSPLVEHLSSSMPVPGEAPRVVPYQPPPKQVRTGAGGTQPNKPFSALATVVGGTGTSGRGGEIKDSKRGERGVRGAGSGPHALWEAAHRRGAGARSQPQPQARSPRHCGGGGKKATRQNGEGCVCQERGKYCFL